MKRNDLKKQKMLIGVSYQKKYSLECKLFQNSYKSVLECLWNVSGQMRMNYTILSNPNALKQIILQNVYYSIQTYIKMNKRNNFNGSQKFTYYSRICIHFNKYRFIGGKDTLFFFLGFILDFIFSFFSILLEYNIFRVLYRLRIYLFQKFRNLWSTEPHKQTPNISTQKFSRFIFFLKITYIK